MCLLILIGRRLDQRKGKMLYSVAVLKIYVKRTPEGVLFSLTVDKKYPWYISLRWLLRMCLIDRIITVNKVMFEHITSVALWQEFYLKGLEPLIKCLSAD